MSDDIPEIPSFSITMRLRTVSMANVREHWAVRAKRNKAHRAAVAAQWVWCPEYLIETPFPLVVTLTRYGKRLLDDDNLAGSFKAIRDEVALGLGRDDNPGSGISWVYRQEKSKDYLIKILVEAVQ
jgi:hypothetical protein